MLKVVPQGSRFLISFQDFSFMAVKTARRFML